MSDLFNKLKKGLGDNIPGGKGNSAAGMIGAAGVGGIFGALFGGSKGVKKAAKNAAVIGGSAALAALAYKMYQNWSNKDSSQNTQQQPQQSQGGFGGAGQGGFGGAGHGGFGGAGQGGFGGAGQGGFGGAGHGGFGGAGQGGFGGASQGGFGGNDPFADFNNQQNPQLSYTSSFGHIIIEAMVFAARADGHIDADEQKIITNTAQQVTNDPNFMNTIRECLQKPLDPRALARKVTSYEQGLDVYRLSAAAIETDNSQEHNYLLELSVALNIDANTKARLDAEAAQFRAQVTR